MDTAPHWRKPWIPDKPLPSLGTGPTVCSMPLDARTTRDLSRAAKNVTTWTEKRNALIHAAHAGGGGIREIARATGLNVATVHNIIKPRARGGSHDAAGE